MDRAYATLGFGRWCAEAGIALFTGGLIVLALHCALPTVALDCRSVGASPARLECTLYEGTLLDRRTVATFPGVGVRVQAEGGSVLVGGARATLYPGAFDDWVAHPRSRLADFAAAPYTRIAGRPVELEVPVVAGLFALAVLAGLVRGGSVRVRVTPAAVTFQRRRFFGAEPEQSVDPRAVLRRSGFHLVADPGGVVVRFVPRGVCERITADLASRVD